MFWWAEPVLQEIEKMLARIKVLMEQADTMDVSMALLSVETVL